MTLGSASDSDFEAKRLHALNARDGDPQQNAPGEGLDQQITMAVSHPFHQQPAPPCCPVKGPNSFPAATLALLPPSPLQLQGLVTLPTIFPAEDPAEDGSCVAPSEPRARRTSMLFEVPSKQPNHLPPSIFLPPGQRRSVSPTFLTSRRSSHQQPLPRD